MPIFGSENPKNTLGRFITLNPVVLVISLGPNGHLTFKKEKLPNWASTHTYLHITYPHRTGLG